MTGSGKGVADLAAFVEARRPETGNARPGAAVAVRDRHGWRNVCLGAADMATGRPIDGRTGFRIASLSKPLLGLALIRLEAEGRLSLDEPLARFLPWIGPAAGDTPIRLFANHRSGFHEKLELLTLAGADHTQKVALDRIRALLARQRATNFAPGSGYLYCNTGFTLLSDLLEAITGRPFGDALRDLVLAPLGMTGTVVLEHDDGIFSGMARGHVGAPATRRHGFYGFPVRGEGGVVSCLDDLRLLADAFIEDRLPGVRRARITHGTASPFGYEAGFVRRLLGDVEVFGHAGHLPGFKSEIAVAPDAGAAVVWLANDDGADAFGATVALLRTTLGHAEPARSRLPGRLTGRWTDPTEGAILDIDAATATAALFGDPFPLLADGDGWRAEADVINLCLRPDGDGVRLIQGGRDLGSALRNDGAGWTPAHAALAGDRIAVEADTRLAIERDGPGYAIRTFGPFGYRGPEALEPLPGGRALWRAFRDPWTVWYTLAPAPDGSLLVSSARMRNLRARPL